MPRSKMNKRGQVTVPKAIREALGVGPGDKLRYAIVDDGVLVLPVRPTSSLFGMLPYDGPPISLEEIARVMGEDPDRD